MKTLVINRNKWKRGGNIGKGETQLLNTEGYMCCLGFHALQFTKAVKKDILECGNPYSVKCNMGNTILLNDPDHDSDFTGDAITINDDNTISEKVREERLTKLFRTKRYDIKFTGKKEYSVLN